MIAPKSILLTIDVEDWFQVENFKPWIPFETWDNRELRVERNVHRLLDLMDSVELKNQAAQSSKLKAQSNNDWDHSKIIPENTINPVNSDNPINKFIKAVNMQPQSLSEVDHHRSNIDRSSRLFSGASQQQTKCNAQLTKHNPQLTRNKSHAEAPASDKQQTTYNKPTKNSPKATFFVLGWLADRLPNLVREIQSRGHEIASHGYNHQRPDQLCAAELKTDLSDSKKLLEDIIGSPVAGYRAPSFAINDDILKIIEDCGYRYDSSYNSFGLHGRYGRISLNGAGKCGLAHKISDTFFELPLSNLR